MNYKKYCLIKSEETTFKDVVNAIEQNGIGAVIIVDKVFKILGIVTDGDVRRCVLQSTYDLTYLINTEPDVWPSSKSKISGVNYLKKIHRNILPIVNKENQVIDIICLDEINFNMIDNYVVLMAGGLGTRLMPLTKELPKPMLPINGKPILERIIEKLIAEGFQNFYISINYLGSKIKEYFGDGTKWGINIKYIEEDKRLGTAGALSKIKNILKDPFLVMNGDIITDLNFKDLLEYNIEKCSMATMCLYKQEYQIPFGVVEFNKENRIIKLKEKPKYKYYINMGIYALHPEACMYIPDDIFFDMPTLFQKLIDKNKSCDVYHFDGAWNDIGRLDEYKSINLLGEN
jgi:dTDP-glucose pyrophosphorylase